LGVKHWSTDFSKHGAWKNDATVQVICSKVLFVLIYFYPTNVQVKTIETKQQKADVQRIYEDGVPANTKNGFVGSEFLISFTFYIFAL